MTASLVSLSPTSAASTAPETFATLFSEPGDWVGAGQARYYHSGNADIDVTAGVGSIVVRASGGNRGDWADFEFTAPSGQELQVGTYEHAQRSRFREAGRAGIDVSADHRGCNNISGRFTVKQMTKAPVGPVTSFWILFEQHCENGIPASFGEIRYNVAGDGGTAVVGPRDLRWPNTYPLADAIAVPVAVVNPGPAALTLGASTVTGGNAADFSIRLDECRDRTLAAQDECLVWMKYSPQDPGNRSATLTIPEAGGAQHLVALTGYVYDGTTRLAMHATGPAYGVQQRDWQRDPSTTRFGVWGDQSWVYAVVVDENGDGWTISLRAPEGDVLVPGDTYSGTRDPWGDGSGAATEVEGPGTCYVETGSFTIHELVVNRWSEIERLSAGFELLCGSSASRGVVDVRATAPAPDPGPYPTPTPDPDPTPTPDPDPDPDTEPEPEPHVREISLRFGKQSVLGGVSVLDGALVCVSQVPVSVQRKTPHGYRTVARTTTSTDGTYGVGVKLRRGRYRAIALELTAPDGSTCERAIVVRRRT